MGTRLEEEWTAMEDMTCPWCDTDLVLRVVGDDQTCTECGTRWSYEDAEAEVELPLAA
jgi:hypothetical protein